MSNLVVTILLSVFCLIAIVVVDWGDETRGSLLTLLLAFCLISIFATRVGAWEQALTGLKTPGFLPGVLVYLVVGVGWSFFRWARYVRYVLKEAYHSATYKDRFLDEIQSHTPEAKDNIDKLTTWIFWWPFSVIRYLLVDLLSNVTKAIVKKVGFVYDSISKSITTKILKEKNNEQFINKT